MSKKNLAINNLVIQKKRQNKNRYKSIRLQT